MWSYWKKDRHPRFHIGESLLPMNLPILERLGVLEQVNAIGVLKYGAEFGTDNDASQTIYFSNALDKTHPYAFQVRRAEFDHLLLRNSRAKGVTVHEGIKVKDIDFRPNKPRWSRRSMPRAITGSGKPALSSTPPGVIRFWRVNSI